MTTDKIKGEGEFQLVRRVRVRVECDNCGEPADQRHTYLLDGYRSNPQSSAYRKDDCSWCSDKELFSCAECRKGWSYARPPTPAGYSECSTYSLRDFKTGEMRERFAHMFLTWKETDLTETLVGHVARIQASAVVPIIEADGLLRGELSVVGSTSTRTGSKS